VTTKPFITKPKRPFTGWGNWRPLYPAPNQAFRDNYDRIFNAKEQEVDRIFKTIEVTPVVSASSAYQANDQVGGIQTLANATQINRAALLTSISVLDKAKQKKALTLFFFDRLPTVASADNDALSIIDAEMLKCRGHVVIAETDYQDVAASSVACVKNLQLVLESGSLGSLYVVVMTTGAPTYAAVGDLVFTYAFEQGE